ncbi:HAD-like domain-containing protein [Aspergillus californicus]
MADGTTNFPPVRACLFDMDGLLIDSEDKYTDITNSVLHKYGKPTLPWSIKAQLQGRPQPAAAKIFHEWAQLPISPAEYLAQITALQVQFFPKSLPLPGVETLLANLVATGKTENPVHIALATSSHRKNYNLKTDHLQDLFSLFPAPQRVLGDDPRIGRGRGKPLPDIYLLALETINTSLRERGEREITPEECLVFEDAVPGVEAGRRAGMRVIWCPHPGLLEAFKGREAEVLAGLMGEHKEIDGELQSAGKPGELDDGKGELLSTLENFPYEKYGIRLA